MSSKLVCSAFGFEPGNPDWIPSACPFAFSPFSDSDRDIKQRRPSMLNKMV